MKNIRDSVHGNIRVPINIIKDFIDTPEFQRLRRIEQTAIRSIYPSARHDRFIHSLGVFHIGNLIQEHLLLESTINESINNDNINCIKQSYLLACLLHDIAHAPFSHTFEAYYGTKKDLYERLEVDLKVDLSNDEINNIDNPNFHEYASAILTAEVFSDRIIAHDGDVELVCRMIIGFKYNDDNPVSQIRNIFISLIHGDIIDADRMDYACRDVWASGYCTSSIDINRIIQSMHINRDSEGFKLCFDCNSINEIWNMLEVRRFQNRYVINHHSVQYEQKLMVMAALKAAANKIGKSEDISLQEFVNIDKCKLEHYCDEDLLTLIKEDYNKYGNEFLSRQYTRIALWKTIDEFYALFPEVQRYENLECNIFEEKVIEALKEDGFIQNAEDTLVCNVTFSKPIDLSRLNVLINNEIKQYGTIYPKPIEKQIFEETKCKFYYVYVPKQDGESDSHLRHRCIEKLKPVIHEIYSFDYKRNNLLSILKFAMNYSTDIAEFDSEKLAEAILSIEEWKND